MDMQQDSPADAHHTTTDTPTTSTTGSSSSSTHITTPPTDDDEVVHILKSSYNKLLADSQGHQFLLGVAYKSAVDTATDAQLRKLSSAIARATDGAGWTVLERIYANWKSEVDEALASAKDQKPGKTNSKTATSATASTSSSASAPASSSAAPKLTGKVETARKALAKEASAENFAALLAAGASFDNNGAGPCPKTPERKVAGTSAASTRPFTPSRRAMLALPSFKKRKPASSPPQKSAPNATAAPAAKKPKLAFPAVKKTAKPEEPQWK